MTAALAVPFATAPGSGGRPGQGGRAAARRRRDRGGPGNPAARHGHRGRRRAARRGAARARRRRADRALPGRHVAAEGVAKTPVTSLNMTRQLCYFIQHHNFIGYWYN